MVFVNQEELDSLDRLSERYENLTKPSLISKTGQKVSSIVPKRVKALGTSLGNNISESKIYQEALKIIGTGYNELEKQAVKFSISEKSILSKFDNHGVNSLNELCTLRSYEIAIEVNKYRSKNLILAATQGGVTGAFGFFGIPFNLVLSNFLYFRAVQSIAMYYGYDVKNSNEEMIIANTVFMNALSPNNSSVNNELSGAVAKVVLISKATVVGQTAKKSWTAMAERGGISLVLTQIRALANKAAAKALEKTGQKGIENTIFKETFELIGKKLTQKSISKSIPFVSAGVSLFIDSAQMAKILEYADIFYQKRFILEKDDRINELKSNQIIDVDFVEK